MIQTVLDGKTIFFKFMDVFLRFLAEIYFTFFVFSFLLPYSPAVLHVRYCSDVENSVVRLMLTMFITGRQSTDTSTMLRMKKAEEPERENAHNGGRRPDEE